MKSWLSFILIFLSAGTLAAAEREVRLERSFGTLCGTLRMPAGGSRTAALLIAGSGPTDRNCNSAAGLYTNTFIYLAEVLERQGIASLRYDKRGVGASRYNDPEKRYDISFDDFVDDAAAWVEWLRGAGFEKVVLLGHSEGSLIALCVAAGGNSLSADAEPCFFETEYRASDDALSSAVEKEKAADETPNTAEDTEMENTAGRDTVRFLKYGRPDGVVSLAGAGFPLDEVLLMQLAAQFAATDMALLFQTAHILHSLKQGRTVESYPRELAPLFQLDLQRYWISQLKYNPQELIRRVTVPVLIVNGDNDLQISTANAEALKRAKPDARLLIIPGMTHPLKQSEGRDAAGQTAVYMDGSLPLDPTLAEILPQFILE